MIKIEEELRMAKAIMSQHVILCRDKQLSKRTRIREENSVATKEFFIATEIAKDLKKSYHNRENSVVTELTS